MPTRGPNCVPTAPNRRPARLRIAGGVGLLLLPACVGLGAFGIDGLVPDAPPFPASGGVLGERPEETAKAVKKRLARAGHRGLAGLAAGPDFTLALAAAWEESLGPTGEGSAAGIQRFLRFLEQRTGVKVPPRWEYFFVLRNLPNNVPHDSVKEEYLTHCDFLRRDQVTGDILPTPVEYAKTAAGIMAPAGVRVSRSGGDVVFEADGRAVRVLEAELPEGAFSHDRLAVAAGPDRWFLAFHHTCGYLFQMACVDARSGRGLWETNVWATGLGCFMGNWPEERVTVVPGDGLVVVFGESLVPYIEGFDIRDGRPVFRFSTNYW
jgi:hypothetical protein